MSNLHYPLLECRDCLHHSDCELVPKITELQDNNHFLDMSGASCADYEVEHVVDDEWTLSVGNAPIEPDMGDEDPPTQDDMFASFEDAMDSIYESGKTVVATGMSYDTSQLFLSEEQKGKELKTLESTLYGKVEIYIDDAIPYLLFYLMLGKEDA